MESNDRTRMPRRRCISEIGVQASDFFAAAAAEQLSPAVAVEQLTPAATAEQLTPAAALFEELEVTKRKDSKSAHKKRMAKEKGKVPAQAVTTAFKNSQEERLRQLRLELLQGTAQRERRQLASSLKQLRLTGRISNVYT
jgi:hypothetical protein